LDVGCGTGVLVRELSTLGYEQITGLDIDYSAIQFAKKASPGNAFSVGDAYQLPFPQGKFDLVFCHFVLLWLANPVMALSEMKRVLRPGGQVFILAEPDHDSRIDFPDEFVDLGRKQTLSLEKQGVDIDAGRQVGKWLSEAGFLVKETGVLGGQWATSDNGQDLEWKMIAHDIGAVEDETIQSLKQMDIESRRVGKRILFVPVFYAQGQKKP
jgi:SAM-dependent methyltransferase